MPRKTTTKTTRKATTKKAARKTTTSKKAKAQKPAKVTLKAPQSVSEEVQKRAYEIYLERGGNHGNDMGDWLRAEQEVKEKYELVEA